MTDCNYVAVTNIPHSYHAADLRAYFSSFVESGSFICFHFRHRPEVKRDNTDIELTEIKSAKTKKLCCVAKIKCSYWNDFERKFNNEQWTDASNNYSIHKCQLSVLKTSRKSSNFETLCEDTVDDGINEKTLLAMPELRPPELMPNGNVGTPTLVFLDFIQRCLLPDHLITTLKLKFPTTERKRIYSNVSFKYHKGEKNAASKVKKKNQNIEPIQSRQHASCSLDSNCDEFVNKKYNVFATKSDLSVESGSQKMEETNDRNGPDNDKDYIFNQKKTLTKRELKMMKKSERKEILALMNEGIEEHLIAIDKKYHSDEDPEEWDRHEAVEDDPSNQERNKERLYEEEIEQPWEKGGPGVVFYTDAMYWQAKEGDFDEQTTDDLDVDFSPYEGDGPGDKDIQDFLKIRQEARFRSGYDKTDRFSIGLSSKPVTDKKSSSMSTFSLPDPLFRAPKEKIGKFDVHTKGIGRKVLEKQGWADGQGLGKHQSGIKQALKGGGKRPHDKKGLGFVKPKPVIYGTSNMKGTRPQERHLITTAHDDTDVTDPKELLLQRKELTTLKHRKTNIDH